MWSCAAERQQDTAKMDGRDAVRGDITHSQWHHVESQGGGRHTAGHTKGCWKYNSLSATSVPSTHCTQYTASFSQEMCMDAIKKHLELLAEGGKMDEGGRLGPAQETDERFADILICKGSLHPNQKALNSKYPYNIDTNLCEILIQDRGKKYLWEGRTRSWLCFEKKKKKTLVQPLFYLAIARAGKIKRFCLGK